MGFALLASRLKIGAENPTTFWISATDELGGGRILGDELGKFSGIDVGEGTSGTEITGGAREPDEATSGVQDKREGLRWRAETEMNGVSTEAFGVIGRLDDGRIGFTVLEVVSSGKGSRGNDFEGLKGIRRWVLGVQGRDGESDG